MYGNILEEVIPAIFLYGYWAMNIYICIINYFFWTRVRESSFRPQHCKQGVDLRLGYACNHCIISYWIGEDISNLIAKHIGPTLSKIASIAFLHTYHGFMVKTCTVQMKYMYYMWTTWLQINHYGRLQALSSYNFISDFITRRRVQISYF